MPLDLVDCIDYGLVYTYFQFIETSLATIVQLNVYRLTDSRLGFYHTGLEFRNREYTFCFANGIIHHPPRKCKFAVLLGRVTLGPSLASYEQFWDIMRGRILLSRYLINLLQGKFDKNFELTQV